MTFLEALKTGKPMSLNQVLKADYGHTSWFVSPSTFYIYPGTWIDPKHLILSLRLTKKQFLSKRWKVKK